MPPRSFGLRTTTNCSFFLSLSFFVLVGCRAWDDSLERDWSEDDGVLDSRPRSWPIWSLRPLTSATEASYDARRPSSWALTRPSCDVSAAFSWRSCGAWRASGSIAAARVASSSLSAMREPSLTVSDCSCSLRPWSSAMRWRSSSMTADSEGVAELTDLTDADSAFSVVVVPASLSMGAGAASASAASGSGATDLALTASSLTSSGAGGASSMIGTAAAASSSSFVEGGAGGASAGAGGGASSSPLTVSASLSSAEPTTEGVTEPATEPMSDSARRSSLVTDSFSSLSDAFSERRLLRSSARLRIWELLSSWSCRRAPTWDCSALDARLELVVLGLDALERLDLRLELPLAELELALGGLEALEAGLHLRVGGLELRQADLDLLLLDLESAEAALHVLLLRFELLHVGLESLPLRLERVVAVLGALLLRLELLHVGLEPLLLLVEVVDAGLQAPFGLREGAVLLVELVDLGLVLVDVHPQEVALGGDVADLGAPADELRLEPGDADLETLLGQLQRGDPLDEGALCLLGDVVGVADAPLQVAAPRLKVLLDLFLLGNVHLQDGVLVGDLVLGIPLESDLLLEVVGLGFQPLLDALELVPFAGDILELLLVLAEAALDVIQEPALLIKVAGDLVLETPLLAALLLRLFLVGGECREPLQGVFESLVGVGLLAEEALGLLLHARDLLEEPILYLLTFTELLRGDVLDHGRSGGHRGHLDVDGLSFGRDDVDPGALKVGGLGWGRWNSGGSGGSSDLLLNSERPGADGRGSSTLVALVMVERESKLYLDSTSESLVSSAEG
ncbi:autotransporter adhesin [Colletotrichum higginsianum]|nr:autotransporter adhesin [Colletotrichum higginsianum]